MLPWAKPPSLLISIIAVASLLISLILFLPPYSLFFIHKLEKSFEKFSAHNNNLLPQILQCIPTLFRVKANVITLVWKMILSNPPFLSTPQSKIYYSPSRSFAYSRASQQPAYLMDLARGFPYIVPFP